MRRSNDAEQMIILVKNDIDRDMKEHAMSNSETSEEFNGETVLLQSFEAMPSLNCIYNLFISECKYKIDSEMS